LIGEKDTAVVLKSGRIVRILDYIAKSGKAELEYVDDIKIKIKK